MRVILDKRLNPRLERERGSGCVNLSARERNAAKIRESAGTLIIGSGGGYLVCSSHAWLALQKAFPAGIPDAQLDPSFYDTFFRSRA